MAPPQSGCSSTEKPDRIGIWKCCFFEERGKPEYSEKNLSEQRREPTTNSTHTCGVESGNRFRATLVGGECSHHCTIPAPQEIRQAQTHCTDHLYKPCTQTELQSCVTLMPVDDLNTIYSKTLKISSNDI